MPPKRGAARLKPGMQTSAQAEIQPPKKATIKISAPIKAKIIILVPEKGCLSSRESTTVDAHLSASTPTNSSALAHHQ